MKHDSKYYHKVTLWAALLYRCLCCLLVMEPELLGHSYKTFIPFLPWHLLCTWSASLVCHQYRQYSVDYSAKAFCVLILKTSGDSMAKPVSVFL